MPTGLPISQLPSLSTSVQINDYLPVARSAGGTQTTFKLNGSAFISTLSSVGAGTSLVGPNGFDISVGNELGIKSLSATSPININDDGSTITISYSANNTNYGVTPINCPITGANGVLTSFSLPNVALPTSPYAYRVDINGVLQKPGVDYSINYGVNPFNIQFTTAPLGSEQITVLAFAPTVSNGDINTQGNVFLPALAASTSYADDTAAAAGGVSVGQLYRNGSVVQIRVS